MAGYFNDSVIYKSVDSLKINTKLNGFKYDLEQELSKRLENAEEEFTVWKTYVEHTRISEPKRMVIEFIGSSMLAVDILILVLEKELSKDWNYEWGFINPNTLELQKKLSGIDDRGRLYIKLTR
jgi:hypothetical protein